MCVCVPVCVKSSYKSCWNWHLCLPLPTHLLSVLLPPETAGSLSGPPRNPSLTKLIPSLFKNPLAY